MFTRSTIFRECYATFVLAHGYALTGCAYGFSGIIIPQMKHLTITEQSWIGAIPNFVGFVFTFFVVYVMGKFGRKQNLSLVFLIHLIGWCSLVFARNVFTMCLCFILIGYGTANVIPAASTYISETCQTKRRGMFMSIDTLCIAIGSSVDYILGSFLSWRVTAIVVAAIALSGFIQSFLLPETKYWHLLTDDWKAAASSLSWFEPQLTKSEVEQELNNIYASIKNDKIGTQCKMIEFLKAFGNRKYRKSFAVALILPSVRSFCGIPIATSYPVEFFEEFPSPYNNQILSVLFGILQTFGCLLNLAVFRYFKRKSMFYSYSWIMIVTLGITLGYRAYAASLAIDPFPWIPIVCMLVYVSIAATGFMSCVAIIAAESQDPYFRAEAMSIFVFVMSMGSTISIYSFPIVRVKITWDAVLCFFVCVVVVGLVTVFCLASETSQKKFYETGNDEAVKS